MHKYLIVFLVLASAFACKTPEARKPESVKTGFFIEESVARNKKLYETEKKKIETYINSQTNRKYVASENGFWYTTDSIVKNDTLKRPDFGDLVNFNFNISDLNGNLIYSKAELQTRNYAMDQEELFSGLREGLKLMKAGETFTFIFPSQKAYGYYGDENKIGTNVPIVSQVTINAIEHK